MDIYSARFLTILWNNNMKRWMCYSVVSYRLNYLDNVVWGQQKIFEDRKPFASQVKAVNTIIGKSFAGRTLTEVIKELRTNNSIRDNMCQFDRLIDIINHYTDKEGKRAKLEAYF